MDPSDELPLVKEFLPAFFFTCQQAKATGILAINSKEEASLTVVIGFVSKYIYF